MKLCTDLSSTLLKITARVLGPDGTGIAINVLAAPVNNFIHSIFSKVTVDLNGSGVSDTTHTYAYKAYLETLLNFSSDTKNGELSASLWYSDEPGKFNNTAVSGGGQNSGFVKRKRLGGEGKLLPLMGSIKDSVLNQDKYLLDGVDVRITLFRSKDDFCILRADGTMDTPAIDYKTEIESAVLYVRRVNLSPHCQMAINSAMEISPAKYEFVRTDIRTYSIPTGVTEFTQANLVLGQIPRRLILFFVKTTAYHGTYSENPFNMENLDINFVQLQHGGTAIPSSALTPNFNYQNGDYVRSYMQFQDGLYKSLKDEDAGISYESFGKGSTFFIFKLAAEDSIESCVEPGKRGSINATVRFGTPVPYPITVFCYREFDSSFTITKEREVELDYIV